MYPIRPAMMIPAQPYGVEIGRLTLAKASADAMMNFHRPGAAYRASALGNLGHVFLSCG